MNLNLLIPGAVLAVLAYVYVAERARWAPFNGQRVAARRVRSGGALLKRVDVQPATPAAHSADAPPVARTGTAHTGRSAVDLERMHDDAARARWARVACAPTSDERRQTNEACARHLDTLLVLEDQRATTETGSPAHRTVLASEPFGVTLSEQALHAQSLTIAHEVGERREPVGS
ncbi:hypothetical protein [Clavibacter nebraskensis]|uniref:hypothetical protein n=1 Tax=Clavibacter nebraskensis TaxID=31963 RepID=UPI003F4B40AF